MNSLTLQTIRFGVIGLSSNVLLYFLYLFLTKFGVDPKLAITFSYAIGLMWTFTFNKRWSFSHQGDWKQSSARFLFLYGMMYLINILVLAILVDTFQRSYVFVQLGVFVVYLPIVFLVQRYWVFRNTST